MAPTPRLGLRRTAGGDPFLPGTSDLPQIVDILDEAAIWQESNLAGRPDASDVITGTLHRATDTGDVSVSDGSAWFTLTPANRSAVGATMSATVTAPNNNNGIKLTFDTEQYDVGGDFGSNKFVAPVKGLYEFSVYAELTAGDGLSAALEIYKNGATAGLIGTANSTSAYVDAVSGNRTIQLDASDEVEIYGRSLVSGTRDFLAGARLAVKLIAQLP